MPDVEEAIKAVGGHEDYCCAEGCSCPDGKRVKNFNITGGENLGFDIDYEPCDGSCNCLVGSVVRFTLEYVEKNYSISQEVK